MSIVIFLMGVTSSGKSSLATALKNKLENDFIIVGFDYAVLELDRKYWPGGSHEKEGFYFVTVDSEHGKVPEIRHGLIGEKFLKKLIEDIIELQRSGKNLIIDMILSEEEYQALLLNFKECSILHVGLKPPLDEVIKREQERGDRKIGIGKFTYENFYRGKIFDIEINTKELSPETAADEIKRYLLAKMLI